MSQYVMDDPDEMAYFEWNKLNCAVKRMRLKKAPGLDGLTSEMFRRVWCAIPEYVKDMYDDCLRYGYFPREWKVGKVITLLKSPEKVKTDVRSYRPICLLSVLRKVLERLLVERMEKKVNVMGGMNVKQYDFRHERSTDDA